MRINTKEILMIYGVSNNYIHIYDSTNEHTITYRLEIYLFGKR